MRRGIGSSSKGGRDWPYGLGRITGRGGDSIARGKVAGASGFLCWCRVA